MLRETQELRTGQGDIDVFSWIRLHPRAAGAIALTTALLVTGCGLSTTTATGPPPVHATVEVPHATGLKVAASNGRQEFLSNGTEVDTTCVDGGPFNLQAVVESGPYVGITVTQVPRADLSTPRDSGQDPFGPLKNC